MSTSSASLEHEHEHETHGLPPYVRVARAKAIVLMLIVSDALSVLAILAAGGYLSGLNTEGQFRIANDFAPPLVPGLLVMIGLVLSGISYFLWERQARRPGVTGQTLFLLVALVLMFVAGVGETWIAAALRYGVIIQAYESVQLLITWFTAMHLLLAAFVGLLLIGRVMRGRIAGHEFLVESTGYWWYYTIVASLLLWIFALLLT